MATKKQKQLIDAQPQHDERVEVTLGIRVPRWVAEFYQRQAEIERRKTSAVARLVLVDYAEKGRAA